MEGRASLEKFQGTEGLEGYKWFDNYIIVNRGQVLFCRSLLLALH